MMITATTRRRNPGDAAQGFDLPSVQLRTLEQMLDPFVEEQQSDRHHDHDQCIEQQNMRQSARLGGRRRRPLRIDVGELPLIADTSIEQGQHLLIRCDHLGLIEQCRGIFV